VSTIKKINNKRIFTQLWLEGRFGNRPLIWHTIEEAIASGFRGEMLLRYYGNGHGGPLVRGLTAETLLTAVDSLVAAGWSAKDFYVAEVIPDHYYRMNAKMMELPGHGGIWLEYSTVPAIMRESFRLGEKRVNGIRAKTILQTRVEPNDLEFLLSLLEDFPDHVVEFSSLSARAGINRQRFIVWEVRNF
jgi:hypothetical protein